MNHEPETPLRSRGLRTAEGWVLIRDAGSSYHDGVEDALREVFLAEDDLQSTSTELQGHADGPAQAFQLDAARANIVRSLDIPADATVLEIGAGLGAVTRYLGERARTVDAIEPAVARARAARARTRDLSGVEVFVGEHTDVPAVPTYDVIVVVGVLEYVGGGTNDPSPYVDFLEHLQKCLNPGGTLAVAIENKLGVKYLVGAPEDHTDKIFDGIEGYPAGASVRTFSRTELESLFVRAGLVPTTRIAFPDYKLTRAVMDAELLGREAPDLLRNLPAFPSIDLRSPRPRLADEQLVWGTFVEAGLAAEVGNSFLVLAGKGSQQSLWPAELGAVYFSRQRREAYAFEKRVVVDDDGLRIVHRRVGRPMGDTVLEYTESEERVVPGQTLLELAANRPLGEVTVILGQWRELLAGAMAAGGDAPLDLVPNNIVVTADGTLVPIDQEWFAPGWSMDRVLRRGVLWFAAMLVRGSVPSRWEGFAKLRDVLVALGLAVGLDTDGRWIETALDEEGEFFTEISSWPRTSDRADVLRDHRSLLESMLDDDIHDLPLGERLPETFERVRRYLATSEESVAHLRAALEAAAVDQAELDRARQASAEAEREASGQARKAQLAEAQQAFLVERLAVAESRYGEQAARASAAETALAGLRGSRAFRLIALYYRIVERLAPRGTRRRRLYGGGLRRLAGLGRRLRGHRHASPAALTLPMAAEPRVSIVVPVYGKWDYTRRCLEALAQTRGSIPFEVVVVDDVSPDDSLARLREVAGVRVVAHETNTGYVGACNSGIAAARGEYVVLLNNDTRVDPDWLVPLVGVLDDDPTVGLVGSRLVYPDGRLQEAGGIIFSDGSGWNYGKFAEPEDPAFTYRRDVDYCSGASIMIRSSVLRTLGGLDQRFAPAYYDDADLAFGVRGLGYRTVYEPTSVVIHDEGISHGTDETSGIKAYQAVNRRKFEEKWAPELATQLPPDPGSVQRAARRRQGRGTVVVIDHYVPRPDEDAGSVRMFALLKSLRDTGYGVLFVPDNRHRSEPYTRKLQNLGVEVLYGHKNLGAVVQELRADIVAVVASRVTVAWGYMVELRSLLPDVPIIFDTVDLHFLREEREAALRGLDELPSKAVTLRELELAMVRASDTTVVVSPYEQELLRSLVPGADVQVLPTVHEPAVSTATPAGRDGLLFVGSFAHQPNADGLRWFTSQVYPLLATRRPGIRIDIVGRNPLPELVESAPSGVTYHGWVEDLAPLYARSRVVIAPLRYGAGVKGKIGEAMSYGVPVVMTPVGAEGMEIRHGETALVAESAEEFAGAVEDLLDDDELWQRVSDAGRGHIDALFGPARFTERLVQLLPRRATTSDMVGSAVQHG